MKLNKMVSLTAALALAASAFAGMAVVGSAEDTEIIYNFSDLTEAEYATKNATVSVFDGAVSLTAAEKAVSVSVNQTAASPLMNTLTFSSALKAKGLTASVELGEGETIVVYYGGTDSAGTGVKSLSMAVKDSSGTVVKDEAYDERKEQKPYAIAYTAATAGTYTVGDTAASNRTFIYAVVKTNTAFDPNVTPIPPEATDTPTDAPDSTSAPANTPKPTIDPNAKPEINIVKAAGWLETAYVTWTNPIEVEKYNVYIKKDGGEYTKIDDELIRYYGSYYRADAVGLAEGAYKMKIVPVLGNAEGEGIESDDIIVKSYPREGFAFDPKSPNYNSAGVGAYKNDGTLKDNAQVVYVTNANKNTVKHSVITGNKGETTECVGLGEILKAREKGKDTNPLAIRLIGKVDAPNGLDSKQYMQIKGTSNVTMEGIGDDSGTYNWSLLIRDTNNIEVRNIAVMEFYDDGISLDTDNFNDWVHNCDIFYGQNRGGDQKKGDGSLDVKSGSDYCSFSYNHFWDSGKTSLCGMKVDSYKGYHMTYYGNWFDHSDSRHPRVRGDQVHVYNNYYDGISKYGVGACTGGSVFVENNVFRNTLHPVLTSRQGTDALGDGTFSGEDGGSIKMYNNAVYGGIGIIDGKANNTNNADAYVVDERNEQVPETYTAVQGGGKYSNFDTAADMYAYNAVPTEQVVDTVRKYAGRVEGGAFRHEFNDEVDDALYDRDEVLGSELEKYKSSIISEYATADEYPATEGALPSAAPTAKPFDPSVQPTARPSGSGGSTTVSGKSVMWRASDNGRSMTAGEILYVAPEEADDVLDEGNWLTLIGNGVDYKASNKSIGGVSFTGRLNAPSGQTAPTLKENGQNGASLKVITKDSGTLTVYFKLNNGKTIYVTDAAGEVAAKHDNATGSSEYTSFSAEIEGGKEYYVFGDGTNIEYWGASFALKADVPDATDKPGETAKPVECVKLTAEYDTNGRLVSLSAENVTVENPAPSQDGATKIMYWESLDAMKPAQ
ncbi:MAG: hypothetical protein Q4G33_05000 [bacterium]|nr:hypothetical protein [bacterium]